MKMTNLKLLLIITLLTIKITVRSQSSLKPYPVIGEPIPAFTLTNVHDNSKKTFDPRDVKGKWLVIDFWNKYCMSCVASFPKINQLQKEFKDQIQFLLVGRNIYEERDIDQIYERYKKKLGLQITNAYDTVLIDQFGVNGYPFVVIVDPQSTVYAITGGMTITREFLQDLVNKKKPKFDRHFGAHEHNRGAFKPWGYLVDASQTQNDFLYRSVLSKCQERVSYGSLVIDLNVEQGLFQRTCAALFQLYNIAYWGESNWPRERPLYAECYPYPVREMSDPSPFEFYADGTGMYNYSLIVPQEKSTKDYLMEVMRRDLKNYFGYEVSRETRMMPYWSLTATEEAKGKLKSKSKTFEDERDATRIKAKKISMELVLAQIEQYNVGIPIIDDTNIKGLIDIDFSANMMDIEDVRKEFKKLGLILEKNKKEFKVLVIRDPQPAVTTNE